MSTLDIAGNSNHETPTPAAQAYMAQQAIRPHRLFHSRRDGKNCMECLIHGVQTGTISQAEAEERHTRGDKCPQCVANIAKHGNRRAP